MSLSIQNLSVAYNETVVLQDISTTLPAGKITALIGCNGAGKSTMLKAIAGLLPMSGKLSLAKLPLTGAGPHRDIAYMPQDTSATSSLTVLEVILLGRLRSLGMSVPTQMVDEAYQVLNAFGLSSLQTRTLDAVSGGQRQLAFLAQALFRNPHVLLLDEPTAALDLRHQLLVLETLRKFVDETGGVVAVAMHDLNLAAQFSDQVIGLLNGRVLDSGAASKVMAPDRLRQMYGIEAEVHRTKLGHLQIMPLCAVT